MQKAANDLFIDQVREKIGPYGGRKLKATFVEHSIIKHQNSLAKQIQEHYKQNKLELQQEYKVQSASVLLSLYKELVLDKKHSKLEDYLDAWRELETQYFSKVPGQFKYEEWSKFST